MGAPGAAPGSGAAAPSDAAPLAVYTDIVDTDPGPGITLLEAAGFRVEVARSDDPEVIAGVAAEAEALLIGYSPITAALLDRLPRLRIVATQSVGVDMIDLEACKARGITVANLPASATEEVASHALALSLALVRGLHTFDRSSRSSEWNAGIADLSRPSTLTVGVLGLGRIGRAFASFAGSVYGEVLGYDPIDFEVPGVRRVSLDEVLAQSDIVSLHLPLTAETHHLLEASRLAQMRPGARIVNVSRGALIDSAALVAALDRGTISGAGLDVFETEPPEAGDPLWQHERVLATPHAAYLSPQSLLDYVVHQAENVVQFAQTGRPVTPFV
ncbi:MAG: C-terminal binding protein [Microbacteriaceae bacterium]